MDRLAIEFISVLGLPPLDFIDVAARLGVHRIGFACGQIVALPELYPVWTLRGNPALCRDVKQALADHGVAISLGEGFLIRPGAEIADHTGDMDILAELGALRISVVSLESDTARADDQFTQFADLAAERGLDVTVEYMPAMPVGTLAAARDLVVRSGRPNAKILLDAMHLFRSGGSVADVTALDPALVGYAQICDGPLISAHQDYRMEAQYDRRIAGDGELPLRDFVAALPLDCVVGLEIPMREKALAGIGPVERLKPAVEAARALLAD